MKSCDNSLIISGLEPIKCLLRPALFTNKAKRAYLITFCYTVFVFMMSMFDLKIDEKHYRNDGQTQENTGFKNFKDFGATLILHIYAILIIIICTLYRCNCNRHQ